MGELNHGDVEPAGQQVLGDLESDEPATEDDRAARVTAELGLEAVEVREVAQGPTPSWNR